MFALLSPPAAPPAANQSKTAVQEQSPLASPERLGILRIAAAVELPGWQNLCRPDGRLICFEDAAFATVTRVVQYSNGRCAVLFREMGLDAVTTVRMRYDTEGNFLLSGTEINCEKLAMHGLCDGERVFAQHLGETEGTGDLLLNALERRLASLA